MEGGQSWTEVAREGRRDWEKVVRMVERAEGVKGALMARRESLVVWAARREVVWWARERGFI